ncbi:MAG: ABC transporter ATP-binding protein [Deltaproteobacteria bacterium]|jgi:iron complex transport system ATP-binding protein|nr:ABC transporter ATP-binding protein [Deltaproteobacteria bacterium]
MRNNRILRDWRIPIRNLHFLKRASVVHSEWISLEEVTFIRRRRVILDRIHWSVSPGHHWVVLGANGSGKTTLLQLLAGYLWPSKGQITVLGEKFGQIDLRELRKKIGWVGSFLQAQIPSSEKPLDLIVSGKYASIGIFQTPEEKDYHQARNLAERLHCQHVLDLPYGVLSQGEKQRLLIARSLIHHPQLLILDEPCSGLDIVAREQLLRTLEDLGRAPDAPTMIFVTHYLEEIMPVFSHVFLMEGGRCLAQGRKNEMLRSELLTQAFGIPIDVIEKGNRYWARVSLTP